MDKPVYSQGKLNLAHPTLTQSWLTMFEACPFAAHKRYVEGIISPPSGSATRGRSVDAAVTAGCDSVIATGEDLPLSQKEEIAAAHFEKEAPDTDFQGEDAGLLKDRTVLLVDLHHQHVAPILKPAATQEAILVEGEDYDFAGTIDLRETDDTLRDTKTANRRGKHVVSGNAQAALYSFLFEKKYGRRPKRFAFDSLIDTKTPSVEMTEGEVVPTDTSLLMYRMQSAYSEFQVGLKTGVWRIAEQGHWRCESTGKWCAYISSCPKGKR